MPKVNPLRPTGNEESAARRIAFEREARGWSYEGLARRMTEAGYPVQGSAIFKIEKADPPRRITLDEFIGFAKVFELDLTEMVLTPEVHLNRTAQRKFIVWWEARQALGDAQSAFKGAENGLHEYLETHPETATAVETLIKDWVRAEGWDNVDEAVEYFMLGFKRATQSERAAHVARWSNS